MRKVTPRKQGAIKRSVDVCLFFLSCGLQHVIDDFIAIAGMTDADAQPPVILCAKMTRDVLEAIVPAQTTAELEPHLTRRQIELIVHDKHLRRLDAIKLRECAHRLPGMIHESCRHQQPQIRFSYIRGPTLEAAFLAEGNAQFARQSLTKPKPGVMPGSGILGPGVTETNDETNAALRHITSCRLQRPFSRVPLQTTLPKLLRRLRLQRLPTHLLWHAG